MAVKYIVILMALFGVTACSSSDDTADVEKPAVNVKKDTILQGYSNALDSAKSVQSIANENTRMKEEAIDNK